MEYDANTTMRVFEDQDLFKSVKTVSNFLVGTQTGTNSGFNLSEKDMRVC